jgi:CheY-like chemotaxis protein
MPDLDGVQMLQEFRKNPALANILVVVITATHFTRLSRDAVSRFPQVKRILSKADSIGTLAAEIKAVLRETGALPPES